MMEIRRYQETDWPDLWALLGSVFRTGETYAFAPDVTEAEARRIWVEAPTATFVAVGGCPGLIGTYFIKPNQPGLGSHVCNCGYAVAEKARRRGVASVMCTHSQREAVSLGFKSMQFNLVVSTNAGAIRLWKRHGFEVVGTLPLAFNHRRLGYVDALVMYKQLGNG